MPCHPDPQQYTFAGQDNHPDDVLQINLQDHSLVYFDFDLYLSKSLFIVLGEFERVIYIVRKIFFLIILLCTISLVAFSNLLVLFYIKVILQVVVLLVKVSLLH